MSLKNNNNEINMSMLSIISEPGFDVYSLNDKERVKLIRECPGAIILFDNWEVNGDLNLSHIPELQSLPDNLIVNGFLDLSGCTGLTSLPDNLIVNGSLYLDGCTGLTSPPDNLSVNGNLYLDGCTGLTSLPDNLSVKGNIYRLKDKFMGLKNLSLNKFSHNGEQKENQRG